MRSVGVLTATCHDRSYLCLLAHSCSVDEDSDASDESSQDGGDDMHDTSTRPTSRGAQSEKLQEPQQQEARSTDDDDYFERLQVRLSRCQRT
jgi:hypothetical protein